MTTTGASTPRTDHDATISTLTAHMQDVLFSARFGVLGAAPQEEVLDALMPHIDRYVAARLRKQADWYEDAAQGAESATDRGIKLVRADTLARFADDYEAGLR